MVGQYRDGIYKIAAWSHITNAHLVPASPSQASQQHMQHHIGSATSFFTHSFCAGHWALAANSSLRTTIMPPS